MTQQHRPIRSFVRRQGRMSDAQKRALETLWPMYGLDPVDAKLDFAKIYPNPAPVILEIGFGMGEALLQLAEKNPRNNYLGIEVHGPGVGSVLLGIEKNNLKNIRIFNADAMEVLNQCIPDESLGGVHLFFPDPWHKKRHHKRRIVNDSFALLIHAKLQTEGYMHMATDWQNYAERMLEVFSHCEGFINAAGCDHYIARPETRPLTRFEQRGERLGHKIWDLLFIKM